MRICYLANTAIPSTNASAIQIVKMCETFSKHKNDVLLITPDSSKKKNFQRFYNIKNKFKFIKIKMFKKFPLGYKYYLFSLISILESLSFKADIYITRNFFTCFLLTIFKKKIIIELHHDLAIESRIVNFIVKRLNLLNSNSIVKIIAITNSVKKFYISKYNVNEKKIIVLPSGSSININFKYNKRVRYFKIGYFGSLYNSRGFNLILELSRIDKNNKYYLYGDKKNILKVNKNNLPVNFIVKDYVPYKNIPSMLSKMDIFLMPYTTSITMAGNVGDISKFTSPLKLFDYLSVVRAIICSNFKVLKEILKENENAIFIKNYKNPIFWKSEISKLKRKPYKRYKISKNNFLLSKKYNLDVRVNKILNELSKNK